MGKLILGLVAIAIISYALANMLFSLSGFLGLFVILLLSVLNLKPKRNK